MAVPTGKLKFAYSTISNMESKINKLEDTNKQLYKALEELDECYCEVGIEMTKEDRLRHRRALGNARLALATARGDV